MSNTPDIAKTIDAMQLLKDKIKETFISLIPEEQLDALIKQEVDAFFNLETKVEMTEVSKGPEYWSKKPFLVTETMQTPFRALVWQHCVELSMQVMKREITEDYFSNVYIDNKPQIKEAMKEAIAESAPIALENLVNVLSMSNIDMLADRLRNAGHNF